MEDCKKHPCPDCSFCQFCSETRCRACRCKNKKKCKMSTLEQIALFEEINSGCQAPEEPLYYKKKFTKENT